jgi:hypothetical protein
LKLRLRFNEKEVIIHHRSLIIFDGIIGKEREVNSIKTAQSTIAQTVDNIKYKKACIASFFAFL